MQNLRQLYFDLNESRLGELFRYGVSGSIAVAVWLAVLVIMVEVFKINETIASQIGFICATPINYTLQKVYVFKSSAERGSRFMLYCAITVTTLGINTMLFWLILNYTDLHYTLVQIVTTIIIVFLNYYANRTFTFAERATN